MRWLEAVIVAVVLIGLASVAIGARRCSARGGTYVRGLIGMECLK